MQPSTPSNSTSGTSDAAQTDREAFEQASQARSNAEAQMNESERGQDTLLHARRYVRRSAALSE